MQQLTTRQLMAATGLGADRLAQLEKDGVIKRAARDRWPAVETLGALTRFYRDQSRRGHRSAADSELRQARAEEIRVRTAERQHKLLDFDEVLQTVTDMIGIVLVTLSGMPARVSRDLETRRKIEDVIFDLRTTLAERFEEQAKNLQQHGKAVTTPPHYTPRNADVRRS